MAGNAFFRRTAAAMAIVAAASCGGGGSDVAPPAVDLTGYWALWLMPTGASGEAGPETVYLSQTGGMVDGAAISGTVVGNRFVLTAAVDPFTLVVDGTLVGNTATGTLTITGMINATGTFRLERFTPSGTTTASGMLQGIAIDLDTDSAVGSRDYSDPGLTVLEEVEVIAAHGDEHLELDFVPSGLAVGTLAVASTVMVVVTYRNDTASIELDATGGTVTITRYDDDGIAGSYSLTLDGGSTLAGTFDVAFDLEAYSP